MATRGVNKVILIGYLGQDPELRYSASQNPIVTLNLATSESWRDKNTGDHKERTEWHRVIIFGKLADIAMQYLNKGSQVYIEGQNRTRKWLDQSGVERYTTEVIVDMNGTMQMVGNRQQNATVSTNNNFQNEIVSQKVHNKKESNQISSENLNPTAIVDPDDEIPF